MKWNSIGNNGLWWQSYRKNHTGVGFKCEEWMSLMMFYFTGYTQALSKSSCEFLSLLLKSTELKISKYEKSGKNQRVALFFTSEN